MRKKLQQFLRKLIFKYMPRPIFNRLTPCETIAFLLSDQKKLSLKQKLQIKFHLFFCYSCWVYDQQMKLLKTSINKFYGVFFNLPLEKEKKIDELSNRIIKNNCCKK